MLMPKPKETKPQFVHRAIPYYVEEGYTLKQATSMAHAAWKLVGTTKRAKRREA